jgi:alpha-L-fucosidase
MPFSRRRFLQYSALAAAGLALPVRPSDADTTTPQTADTVSLTPGPFKPSWESLAQYECPEWFRDAKFGIWAHWTAQCVPEMGDWYARRMYMQGDEDYNFQCAHYGHPSKVGMKDIDHIWHAENWDPETLLDLYQAAGAKYFVSLANHHDNFDNWNSKFQEWNSVAQGPHKDIVGIWERGARKRGMRFGVTVHAARTWDWFDVSHGSDKTGPLAGVPYDGVLTKADGAGQWWNGLDPAELYGPAGAARTPEAHAAYERKFYNRVMDLVDQHKPDLLYFDDGDPPTDYGLDIVANYYNKNRQWHQNKNEGVLNVKNETDRVKNSMVLDYERGRSDAIAEKPWQTDTCIGDWHYRRSIYLNHSYKTPDQVVKMLVDIVSKNGNLLLNIPVRGDGTIDPDEIAFLHGMAAWMKINGEAIFATRPWKISGEGPVKMKGGGFSEGGEERLTSEDFRFTTQGNVLYATAMDWPDTGTLTVRTLAANGPGLVGNVNTVELLGHGPVPFTHTADGLVATMPAKPPCDHAYVLKITGLDLAASTPVKPTVEAMALTAAPDGTFTLRAQDADTTGAAQTETHGAVTDIGYWDHASDTASWTLKVPQNGAYTVSLTYASPSASGFTVKLGSQSLAATVAPTGDFTTYKTVTLGVLQAPQNGVLALTIQPDPAAWHAINVASLTLAPAK